MQQITYYRNEYLILEIDQNNSSSNAARDFFLDGFTENSSIIARFRCYYYGNHYASIPISVRKIDYSNKYEYSSKVMEYNYCYIYNAFRPKISFKEES